MSSTRQVGHATRHAGVHSPPPPPTPPQSGSSYIEAFLTVLKNVTKDETVQYVLALVEQMLAGAPVGRVGLLGQAAARCCGLCCPSWT